MTFEDKIERGSFTGTTSADVVEVSLPGMSAAMVQLTGTFTATTTFEVLVDEGASPTWKAISATNVTSGVSAATATATGVFSVGVSGARRFRARCSAYTNGTVVVAVNVSRGSAAGSASSGGGGGGASTIADGADAAEGTTTDAGVVTDTTGTVIGFLRGNIIKWISQLTLMGAVTEAAPATDTASSGLNGRLQRIAQRITSLIALVPAALTGSGNFKTSIAESTATVTTAGAKTNNNAAPGATNTGTLPAVANAAVPSWTEGNQVSTSVDLSGRTRVTTETQTVNVAGTTAGGAAFVGPSIPIGFVGTGATMRNATAAPSLNNSNGVDVLGVGPMLKGTTNFFNMAGDDSGRAAIATGTIGPAKAEDAGHTSGDMGIFMLEVRNDTPGTLVNTDLDYAPPQQDSKGQSRVVAAGYTDVISTTLTRPANTTAYTAGDEITDTGGAIQPLTSIGRYSGATGSIQGIYLSFSDNWAVKPTIRVWVYDTTSTPQTDNAAFAPSDGVQDTALGFIDITNSAVADATANTGNMGMDTGLINFPFKTSGSANLFLRYQITNAGQAGANSGTVKARVRVSCD